MNGLKLEASANSLSARIRLPYKKIALPTFSAIDTVIESRQQNTQFAAN
jgi:hypothetical protein